MVVVCKTPKFPNFFAALQVACTFSKCEQYKLSFSNSILTASYYIYRVSLYTFENESKNK